MKKETLMKMEKEQLVDYINLMLDTMMTLEDRLLQIQRYVDRMSFAPLVNNPKYDLYNLLRGEELMEKVDGRKI